MSSLRVVVVVVEVVEVVVVVGSRLVVAINAAAERWLMNDEARLILQYLWAGSPKRSRNIQPG